jgi:hypothetical protein
VLCIRGKHVRNRSKRMRRRVTGSSASWWLPDLRFQRKKQGSQDPGTRRDPLGRMLHVLPPMLSYRSRGPFSAVPLDFPDPKWPSMQLRSHASIGYDSLGRPKVSALRLQIPRQLLAAGPRPVPVIPFLGRWASRLRFDQQIESRCP